MTSGFWFHLIPSFFLFKKTAQTSTPVKSTSGSFGGMKKGFLFGGGGSQKKVAAAPAKSTKNDIPFIRPKSTLEEERQLPEVQQAMQAGQQFLQNKGKTDINTYQGSFSIYCVPMRGIRGR